MDINTHFPFVRWIFRTLTGRWARRVYFAILCVFLFVTTATRLRSYLMVRRVQAVLHGLSAVRLDQTTEEQMKKMVPYLTQREWKSGGISHRGFYTHISNESDLLPIVGGSLRLMHSEGLMLWLEHFVDLLGYRFISFDAEVLVQDGMVRHVDYGLADQWVRPQYPGYTGYIVSARSAHAFWIDRRIPLQVSSEDDESPEYRPSGNTNGLYVTYTVDASPSLTQHAFQLDLNCFWGTQGCTDARKIAPAIWQDIQSIRRRTYQQLISGKCSDSIVDGRMRYLPDITILLLEVTGSRRIEVNEEGDKTEDWFTDYRLIETIRGQASDSWNNIRFRRTIPSVEDPTRTMANQMWAETKVGTRVLFFGNPRFYSCRLIPASASTLEIVRNAPMPPKRPEDQVPWGLQ